MMFSYSLYKGKSDLSSLNIKHRIARNFSRAAVHYDTYDTLQRTVAQTLLNFLPTAAHNILDLGCGTATWTANLKKHYPNPNIIGIDIAQGMLEKAKQRYPESVFCLGDMESLPFQKESFDLIFSNLAVQWAHCFYTALEEAYRVLQSSGYFVFSNILNGSLIEIRQIFSDRYQTSHLNQFISLEDQKNIIHHTGFTIESIHAEKKVIYHENPEKLLKNFKYLGANTIKEPCKQGMMSPQKMYRIIEQYDTFKQDKGVPCTYAIAYTVLKKA